MIKQALQEILDSLPKRILLDLLSRKVKEVGLNMPREVIDAFAEHILTKQEGSFVWHDSPDSENRNIKLEFTKEDIQEIDLKVEKTIKAIPEAILEASDRTSYQIFKRLREKWDMEYAAQQYVQESFRYGMEERWGRGLDYLRMLLTSCRDIGQQTMKRHSKSKSKQNMYRRWVMIRLHTRACQVSDEIICLMENGFADGAMARWRTLHEISIVAALIADGDEDLAERYILHDAVEVKRQADDYDETQVPLGFSPIGKRHRRGIEQQYEAALNRFGTTFAHPYGWAAKHLNLKKPTFKDLQEAADRAGMSSHYKMASFNVHASARSLFFNLASIGDQTIFPAGRSNAGLVDPGERTAHTLALITSLYVGHTLNIDRIIELKALLRIRDAVGPALWGANKRLERDEQARNIKLAERRERRANKLNSTIRAN
ncbi:MAG: DUF5677 domain-containing protein [Thiobacillus sp.]|nr:DUF5677 domain-containing protein [Thiobacillus sp.]